MPSKVFSKGSMVWLEDENEVGVPVEVVANFSRGKAGYVKHPGSNKNIRVSSSESSKLRTVNKIVLKGTPNLVHLRDEDLHDASLLYNLRVRFGRNSIYTNIGSVLISINPFKLLPLYTPEVLGKYRNGVPPSGKQLAPHLYATADRAYKDMIKTGESQSCLISGESGAGKTEATKIFLQYLTEMSRDMDALASRSSSDSQGYERTFLLQEQILKANPLLESFGNACTSKNNNSSRFGKWIEIVFNNKKGSIVGGSVINYLLEKSRIVGQAAGERNYHVFYELCAGAAADSELKKRYQLQDPSEYRVLNGASQSERSLESDGTSSSSSDFRPSESGRMLRGGTLTRKGIPSSRSSKSSVVRANEINDELGFQQLLGAMQVLQMTAVEKDDLLRTVAGILHLGNVEFVEDEKAACDIRPESVTYLDLAAEQLGMDVEALRQALRSRNISNARETVFTAYNLSQARDARDVLAKTLYGKMFDWLIARVNRVLRHTETEGRAPYRDSGSSLAMAPEVLYGLKGEDVSIIGVLDIFGFEAIKNNSFEQLCINYCNEKLQNYFNNHIFKLEQDEYRSQGIDVSTMTYADNSACLAMLEQRRTGLFSMLDEEVQVPNGSDESFLSKLLQVQAGNTRIRVPIKAKRGQFFTVAHYAGYVTYNVKTFLEKNKDYLNVDLEQLCVKSSQKFIVDLFPQGAGKYMSKRRSIRRPSQASESLSQRMTSRGGMNRSKRMTLGAQFKNQLEALMEMLQETQPHFVRCVKPNAMQTPNKFDSLLVLNQLKHSGVLEVCRVKKSGYPVQIRFKQFVIRYQVVASKSLRAKGGLESDIPGLMQDLVNQGIIAPSSTELPRRKDSKFRRRKGSKQRKSEELNSDPDDWQIGHSKVFLRQRVSDKLEKARAAALRPIAMRVQRVVRGWLVRRSLKRYWKILQKVREATEARSLRRLQEALGEAGELPHGGRHVQSVMEATELMESLQVIQKVEKKLKAAIEQDDPQMLSVAIRAAEDLKLSSKSRMLRAAKSKRKKHEARARAIRKLNKAVEGRRAKSLKSAIQKANDLKIVMVDCEELKRATVLLHRLEDEANAVAVMEAALASDEMPQIEIAKEKMSNLGLVDHPVMLRAESTTRHRAEASAERERKLDQLELTVSEAMEAGDFAKLDRVKTTVIELGHVSSPNVQSALDLYAKLQAIRPAVEQLIASSDAIALRSESGMEITDDHIQELAAALERLDEVATENEASEEIAKGEVGMIVENAREQCRLASEIANLTQDVGSIISKHPTNQMSAEEFEKLKGLLESASELNMDSSMVHSVKQLVRENTMNRGQLVRGSFEESESDFDTILMEIENEDNGEPATAANFKSQSALVAPPLPPRRKKLAPVQRTIQQHSIASRSANVERLERAKHRKFHFSNYYAIRQDGDFGKGVYFNKRKVLEHKLKFQSQPLHRSILRLDSEMNKRAVVVHKSILGYSGVMMMPFPTALAQDILQKGLEMPELADEIYIQLFKQITRAPSESDRLRAWQLVCMATGAFAPSRDFEYYVFNFLVNGADLPGVEGTYGSYAVRRLEGTLAQAPYGVVPSMDEIAAYAERPPVLASVFLSDDTAVADNLPVSPNLTVEQVVSICAHFIGIEPAKAKLFGIFTQERKVPKAKPRLRIQQTLLPVRGNESAANLLKTRVSESGEVHSDLLLVKGDGDSKRVSIAPVDDGEWSALRPMSNKNFLGNRVLKAKQHGYEIKFVFRCKLFVTTSEDVRGQPSRSEVFDRLIFMQAQKEIEQGNWPVPTKEQVTQFAALAVAIANDGDIVSSTEHVDFEVLKSAVPATWWRGESADADDLAALVGLNDADFGSIGQAWAERVVQEQQRFPPGISARKLLMRYLDLASRLPFYGTYFALVKKLPAGTVDEIGAAAVHKDQQLDELLGDHELVCGVNQNGLYLLTLEHQVLVAYPFRQIKSVSGASVKLNVVLHADNNPREGNFRLVLYSPQAEDMQDLLLDYGTAVRHTFGNKAKFLASSLKR